MNKTNVLADLYREFGDKAQDALDFIANETNRRKLTWLENEQKSSPVGERVTEPQILIALEGGNYITKDEWIANPGYYSKEDVIGVAVKTPLISFIVSLKQWKDRWSEDTDHCIIDKHNEAQAIQILSSLEHTRQLVNAQEDEGNTAAKLCWNYNYKSLQWYSPSLLELSTICAYKEEINVLLELVGGDLLLLDECYWASTENSSSNAWVVSFGSGYFGYYYKYGSSVVRAVAAFI